MKLACIFPGQGSQKIGMGKAFAENFPVAREVFQEVDEALGQHLSKIMFSGDEAELTLTENAQPAIMANSIAILRVLEKEANFVLAQKASFVAGHSLGEYTALAAAGAISLSETAKLLKLRGQAMQRAVPEGLGSMAAILGLDMAAIEQVTKEASLQGDVCEVANDNAPGQIVISGSREGVERAIKLASEMGAKRALALAVSAPFHCSLMQPAAEEMRVALEKASIFPPCVPLLANITAQAVNAPDTIRDLLVQQVTGRVRWRESVEELARLGVTNMLEIGEGAVLSGLVKRINKDIICSNVSAPADIEGLLRAA